MKKSDLAFYSICLIGGLLNFFEGLNWAHFFYDASVIIIAVIICIMVRNKYEAPRGQRMPFSLKLFVKNPNRP